MSIREWYCTYPKEHSGGNGQFRRYRQKNRPESLGTYADLRSRWSTCLPTLRARRRTDSLDIIDELAFFGTWGQGQLSPSPCKALKQTKNQFQLLGLKYINNLLCERSLDLDNGSAS